MPLTPKNASLDNFLNEIGKARLEDEEICISNLKKQLRQSNYNHDKAAEIAGNYIENFRKASDNSGLEDFFRQYGLGTKEGLAVMSLAEALLRIPDSATANGFIHETLSGANWDMGDKHVSSLVKSSSLGLKIAKNLLEISKTTSIFINPVVRESIKQSLKLVGDHFVLGQTIDKAIKKATFYESSGFTMSYDMLGEGARTEEQAEKYLQSYLYALEKVAKNADSSKELYERPGISVKLSALYSKYKLTNKQSVIEILLPRLQEIILRAKALGVSITIDAEEASRLDISLELFAKLVSSEALQGFGGLGIAVQSYNKAAPLIIDFIARLAKITGRRIPVRLVKGAYWDAEIKTAQMGGIPTFPVYTQKEYSDISYLVCADKMLQNSDVIYPCFATHNALTIAGIQVMAGEKRDFEFQCLYGMGNGVYKQVIGNFPCRIYAPVGPHKELLPYLIRRILENGASTSFLKKIIDEDITVATLVQNPLDTSPAQGKKELKLPPGLYGQDRKNSTGFDFGNNYHLELIKKNLAAFKNHNWTSAPIINGRETKGLIEDVFSPYNNNLKIGLVTQSSNDDIQAGLEKTMVGFANWSLKPVQARTKIIDSFANLLQENQYEATSLCVMEAGKTIADAIAEIREAIDFCRYYAARANELFSAPEIMAGPTGESNELSLHGRGIFVCISPWNFPLAIFTGQIVAALVAGNTVIAKPAEQTPLIAAFAVKLLLKAGLPKDAICLLPGNGELIGKQLLADKRIAGVTFTGSNETANKIQQSLGLRGGAIIPFIAETGGINAMIVDSSALIEQAVDDIITSAFGSAGQRCSALRVLYVQEEIADNLIEILKGGVDNLNIGPPGDFAIDIGPVIDSEAHKNLRDYINMAKMKYKLIAQSGYKNGSIENGYFIAPIAFEIDSIKDLPGEIFGPILHIVRFAPGKLNEIIEDINNCGYGLTLGIHSRIRSHINYIRAHAHIGNIYINRSMIGATVGVQPFGGEGLSGTGPKAGGPNYLMRFVTERSFCENTTAIGGNKDLLV